jgi:uracil-DNA glycosylase family 4
MNRFDDLGREMLEHLRFYREAGVKLVPGRENPVTFHVKPTAPARTAPKPIPIPAPEPSLFPTPAAGVESLEAIRTDLGDCQRCKLGRLRKNIVFGMGNPCADLLFVGEAPGADEDEQGLPFVGRAGQLLTRIIQAMGMRREDVYICNIVKCRPPENRDPEGDEVAACQPFLFRQIAAVKPRVICALGNHGAQTLLGNKVPISKLRGYLIDFQGAKFMATYHPAYLLRNPIEKRKVWEDVRVIRHYLRSLPS